MEFDSREEQDCCFITIAFSPVMWHVTSHIPEMHKSRASRRCAECFVRRRLMLVGRQYGSCFISSFWRLEFWGACYTFGKFVRIELLAGALPWSS